MRINFLLLVAFGISCTGTNYSEVSHEVCSNFDSHQREFENIRNFFHSNNYNIRELDYEDGLWKTRKKDYRTFLRENGFAKSSDIDSLISILTRLNIVEAAGDTNYTEIHFDHGITECYIMRFEIESASDNRKIDSVYYNPKKDDFWLIRLNEHWIAKRVSCL